MATIDELDFKLILDDQDFNTQVKNDIKLANELNTSLSKLLDIKKQIGKFSQDDVNNNRNANKILVDNARAQEKITREKNKTLAAQQKLNAQIERATRGYNQQSRILNELKGMALGYLSIHGASQFMTSLIRITGEFEKEKTTLAAMIGDMNAAENIMTRIKALAVESPFQFKELTTYAKQLSAFSVPAQELYDTTRMLADVSAGLGVGMDRIILAYGQVRSAAFLRGQEVRQFTEAGIPILDELAKQFSELEGRAVSAGEVFDKISDRLVPFEMVAKIFKEMTSEGGKFYNMQEIQAETLKGKYDNLRDAIEQTINAIGEGQSEKLKGALDVARKLVQNYEQTGKALVELAVAYGVYKTALIAAEVATATFSSQNHKLIGSFVTIGQALSKNPYAILAASLAAVGFAAYKSFTQLEPYEKLRENVAESERKYTNSLASEQAKLEKLYASLRLATKGTEEYDKAKREIYTQYSGYIASLKAEGENVGDLIGIYDKLKTKVNESVQARFKSMAVSNLETEFGDQMDKIEKSVNRTVNSVKRSLKRELTAGEEVGLRKYILGGDEDIMKSAEMQGLNNFLKSIKGFNVVEYTKTQVSQIVNEYQKGKDRIEAIYGETAEIPSTENPFVYDMKKEAKGKSPAQKALEAQIKSVQKLQDAYEKLLPFLDEVQMKSTLKNLFPEIDEAVIDSLDFEAELARLADKLEEFDENAAQNLRDTIGKDIAGAIANSFRAVEEYKKMLDSWLGEDFNLNGKGISLDISKIVSNLNSEYAKIDQKRERALDLLNKAQMGDEIALAKVRETLGNDVWEKYIESGSQAIDALARKEKESARKTAEERIRDLASKYVSEKMTEKNINLSDLDDKTVAQVQAQVDRLKDLRQDVIKEMQEIGDFEPGTLNSVDQSKLDMLEKVLDMIGLKINDVQEDLDKKLVESFVKGINAVSSFGSEIASLGNAIENSGLAKFGEEISSVSKGISSIVEAAQAKDTIALIANIASLLITQVTNVLSAAYEQQRALNEASLEYANTLKEIRRESLSGVFGTDEMALAAENAKILTEAQERYEKVLDKFTERKLKAHKDNGGIMFRKTSISTILSDISEDQGWDLYLTNGQLNIDAIEAYFDAYAKRLTKRQRDLISDLIESGREVEDAAAQQAQYLTDIYSKVADTISSNMVDAFVESGDAAINMGEIVSDTAKSMVSDLIKNLYILPILKRYEDQALAIESNTALSSDEKTRARLELLEGALAEITRQEDNINNTLERFSDYLNAEVGGEGTAIGEGIKGITEDQANLLASYLNAIRADVSYSKAIWLRMDTNLQKLADMLVSSPTLMEYQAQIAANTYNTAVYTQAILERLGNVIGVGDNGEAFKVVS